MPRRPASLASAALWLALAVPLAAVPGGCGGGSGSVSSSNTTSTPDPDPTPTGPGPTPPTPAPTIQTIDLMFDVANSGVTTGAGGVTPGQNVPVGDTPANFELRGQLRFNLNPIPAGATLTLATLRCTQSGVTNAPYPGLGGNVNVDHIAQGPGLDIADHASAPLTVNVGSLSADATLETKLLVVTAQVLADLAAARTTSDFRLYFGAPSDGDGVPDVAFFTQNAAGQELTLRVTFTLP